MKAQKQLPMASEDQKFITQYFQRDKVLLYDEKVMEEVDDLSDAEKVSLISDIELEEEPGSPTKSKDKAMDQTELGELNLNLKNISKLNEESTSKPYANSISNGIKLSKSKYKCSHTKSCASCHN